LIKVVAVALVIAFAPYLAGTVLGLTGVSFFCATAAFGAIGDAAVQGLAIATGIQSKFSGTEVLETAVTAATAGSMSNVQNIGNLALSVAATQVATQLTEMALGMRSKFDAREIGLQIASAVAGAKIAEVTGAQPGQHQIARELGRNTATNVINSALGSAVTHAPFNLQTMAANAVGSTIANPLAEKYFPKDGKQQELAAKPKPAEPKTAPASTQDKQLSKELAKAQEAAKIKIPEAKLDFDHDTIINGLADARNKDRTARWQAESGKVSKWNEKKANVVSDNVIPMHYQHDYVDSTLALISAVNKNPITNYVVEEIKQGHLLVHGNMDEKLGAVEHFGIMAATGMIGRSLDTAIPATLRAVKALKPAISRMGMWGGKGVKSAAKGIRSNPFKGKTFEDIDQILTERGFRKVGPDPANGKGSYFHPKTGRKYYLDKGGVYKEGIEMPHVDVHRMENGLNLESVGKRRYPLGETLI
jgi:hypothetical protein